MLRKAQCLDGNSKWFLLNLSNIENDPNNPCNNYADIIFTLDDRNNDSHQLNVELELNSLWNYGKYTGCMKFNLFLYKQVDGVDYNFTNITMTEDTTSQIDYWNYAGVTVTLSDKYHNINDKNKFAFRVNFIANNVDSTVDSKEMFIFHSHSKLTVKSKDTRITDVNIEYGKYENGLCPSKLRKMFLGDQCDYYNIANKEDFINEVMPNKNIYDKNGFTRYQRSDNIAVNNNTFQFKLYNNGVYECNGWVNCTAGEWTIVKLPIPFNSAAIDIVARPIHRPLNDVAIDISMVSADEIRIMVDKSCLVSLIMNYVWKYNGYSFNRELYEIIPGYQSRIATAAQRQKKPKVFGYKFPLFRLLEGGEKCA